MPTPFMSSEEYDERAHHHYNEGKYDEALSVLREGLAIYPNSVELHVGVGYARLARDEFAWARKAFEQALVLDAEHEDALAGLGETLLRFGEAEAAIKSFRKTLELGYEDDLELMLQIGRALFREGFVDESREFFDAAVRQAPESAEAVALVGYAQHRLGNDVAAIATLRRALQLDDDHAEARIYLGNIHYDRGEYDLALYHLDRTAPEDHWDELGIVRLIELKKSMHRFRDDDPRLKVWDERLSDLETPPDALDELFAEIEQRVAAEAQHETKNQLELFGHMLSELAHGGERESHAVVTSDGRDYSGSWDEIVSAMRDEDAGSAGRTLQDFMQSEARRSYSLTGVIIPTRDAESFLRGSADAGLLRIVR
ncbi:MAG: tetratricopeptide repeat protein [Gemmatimonadaceae bacterium]